MEALNDDHAGGWNNFVSSASQAGLAPCDRDCEFRARCFNDRLACKPFERWVHGGGRVFLERSVSAEPDDLREDLSQ